VGGDPGTAARDEAHAVDFELRERELALREAELELRRVEIRLQEQRLAEDNEWRRPDACRLAMNNRQSVKVVCLL